MEIILNQKGLQLMKFKERLLEDNTDELLIESVKLILEKYDEPLSNAMFNKRISLNRFHLTLTTRSEFKLSEQEILQINKQKTIEEYYKLCNLKYITIALNEKTNKLYITRLIGINKTYYENFLGEKILSFEEFKKKSSIYKNVYHDKYSFNKVLEREYKEEISKFETFSKKRLNKVCKDIISTIKEENLYPILKKGVQNYELEASIYPEYSKQLKSFLNKSITLSIDLNKKNNTQKNVEIIIKTFNRLEELIELYMNYNLYLK